ncbi:MAG: tetratricopeptide repeat-containing sulfotransferase family protein [Rhodanobacteraceae bacterium]
MKTLSGIESASRKPPDPFAQRLWKRAQHYIATEQIAAARVALETLVQRDHRHVAAKMLLASVYLDERRVREAAEQAVAASRMLPDDAGTVATEVHCLLRIGEMSAARDCLARFDASRRTLDGAELVSLARACHVLGDHAASLALLERARAQGCDDAEFCYFHALELQFNGRVSDARRRLESCLQLAPAFGRASLTLARMSRQTLESNHLDHIRAQLRCVELGSDDHAAFEFARYKELEDLECYDEAFAALERGNAIMYARRPVDSRREDDTFRGIERLADAGFVHGPGATIEGAVPIFVVGMPRSGTTLLDRMLDNHPDVVSTGERTDFPRQLRWAANLHGDEVIDAELLARVASVDYAQLGRRYLAQTQWRASGSPCYVDKLPPNYALAGLIHRALPQAPILHLVRDPMDVCFSNFRALFGDSYPYSYELHALTAHYVHYRALMRYWQHVMPGCVLDVSYADLVRDPEATLARVFAHCGLRQVSGCSDVTRNATAVNTLSSAQIREPVHTRNLGAWRRYARQLEPLRAALQAAGCAGFSGG